MFWRKSIEQLVAEAYEALDAFDHDRARRIGTKLKRRRHTSGFEVLARAYVGLDRLDDAIAELELGVRLVPQVSVLWGQLACYYSDAGRFEDAHRAFAAARQHAAAHDHWIDLNEAVAFQRQKRDAEALEVLDRIPPEADEPHPRTILGVRCVSLNALQRYAEVIALVDRQLAKSSSQQIEPPAVGHGAEQIPAADAVATLHCERGRARWLDRADRDAALADVWRSIASDRTHSGALWLLREIENERSPTSKLYRVLLHGLWHEALEDETRPGFYATYGVVADSADEAVRLARRFEPEPVHPSLEVEKAEVVEPRPDEPKGVYFVSGRIFHSSGSSVASPG